jgi:hypothetical protein
LALIEQQLMSAAVPRRSPTKDPAQLRPQRQIVTAQRRLATLVRPMLTNDQERSPLQHPPDGTLRSSQFDFTSGSW